jgi:hypothetical protein
MPLNITPSQERRLFVGSHLRHLQHGLLLSRQPLLNLLGVMGAAAAATVPSIPNARLSNPSLWVYTLLQHWCHLEFAQIH